MQFSWIQLHQPQSGGNLVAAEQGSGIQSSSGRGHNTSTGPTLGRSLPVSDAFYRHIGQIIIPESVCCFWTLGNFRNTLVVCQISISIRDRKSEDHQWDIRLDLKESVG